MRPRPDRPTLCAPSRALVLLCAAAVVLGGCAALRRATGQAPAPPAVAAPAAERGPDSGADAAVPAAVPAQPALQAQRVGQEVVVGNCLRFAVLGFTNRSGPLDPADWVTVRVENACDEPVRHLQVDLMLLDVLGRTYGSRLWVLQRGEVLWPGHGKTERFAVPDAADHLPRQWAVRLHSVERPSDRPAHTASRRR